MKRLLICSLGLLLFLTGSTYPQAGEQSKPQSTLEPLIVEWLETVPHHPQVVAWMEMHGSLYWAHVQAAEARRIGLGNEQNKSYLLFVWLTRSRPAPSVGKIACGFDSSPGDHRTVAILTALGRLGNRAMLPMLMQLPTEYQKDPFFRANLARLQAESEFGTPTTHEQWRKKVELYLQAIGLSRDELAEYFKTAYIRTSVRSGNRPGLNTIAVRHLVEMAIEARARGVATAFSELEGIEYQKDPVNALRVELADVPAHKRVEWLIARITQLNVYTASEDYLVQALIDCGESAVPAIRKTLEQYMSENKVSVSLLWALSAIEFWKGCPTLRELAEVSQKENLNIARYMKDIFWRPRVICAADW